MRQAACRKISTAGLLVVGALFISIKTPGDGSHGGLLSFVETAPVETTLDHPDIPETHTVWIELFDKAKATVELAHFYASNREGSLLEPVIEAVERAAARGVKIRFLFDLGFYRTYSATQDRLEAIAGVTVRRLDLKPKTGGVLHAKTMIVDQRTVVVGSANFDWRSLEHIQELGVRIENEAVARAFGNVFELDWALAGDPTGTQDAPRAQPLADFPVEVECRGEKTLVTPIFSPKGLLPDGSTWDLPVLVDTIDGAQKTVQLQLLSYATTDREGRFFDDLENALRRAAARGVKVELLLSHWSKRRWKIEGLKSLTVLPRIEVRLAEPPQAAEGFIPFARVAHAKFMVVDGERAWVGTSNWSRDYFHSSRNAGLLIEGKAAAEVLTRYFSTGWTAPMTEPVDPGRKYESPRVGD